ncbi:MAG: DNA repair protein RadC [Bacilli bacterium]|nr:DNA repair protein RadC [Bacilli bacterium]
MLIKEYLKEERPRERALIYGIENVSNEELLSIILKNGTKNKGVRDLSIEILKNIENIENFRNINIIDLMKVKGIGEVKAIEIIAAIELGKRVFIGTKKSNLLLKTAKEIYDNYKYLFFDKKQEYFYCLYFDNKQRVINCKLLFIGTINKSIVHPREVFKEAYSLSASRIVCLHNHPSGDISPSIEDKEITKALYEIGKINGIYVVDHIIFSNDNYYSFYEKGNIFKY